MRKRQISSRLHDYFFPHKRNGYRPHIFRTASIGFIVLGVLVFESAYLTQIKFVFPHTNFLGAVLPGALVALTNSDRVANDVSPVTDNAQLAQAAQDAANDMATQGYFAHVSPDGKDPWYWLKLVGYNYQYAGQNLAVNFTDSIDVENAWMASPTHHANIVKSQYTQVGIGVANGMYQGKNVTFVVQFFATPAAIVMRPQKVAVSAPVSTNQEVAMSTATTTTLAARVLGTETQATIAPITPQSRIGGFFATVFTSPNVSITYILSALACIILILLVIAIAVGVRKSYIEMIAGALVLFLVILGLLFFNMGNVSRVQVSSENNSVVPI